MNIRVILIFCLATVFSCNKKRTDNTITTARREAKNNALTLESVLKFYMKPEDSLKRQAAVFLFRNLNLHYENYAPDAKKYGDIFNILDTLNNRQFGVTINEIHNVGKSVVHKYGPPTFNGQRKVFDGLVLTPEFLITNIEFSFKVWKKLPWNKEVSFENFCEYILPYRIVNEKVEYWKPAFLNRYLDKFLTLENSSDTYQVFSKVNELLKSEFLVDDAIYKYYPFQQSISSLLKARVGVCADDCALKIAIMRSIGLPACMDVIPHWGNISLGHSMVGLSDKNKKIVPMTNANLPVSSNDIVDVSSEIYKGMKVFNKNELPDNIYIQYVKTVPKVYRYTFSRQPAIDSLINSAPAEIVPRLIKVNQIDVTPEYISTQNVSVILPPAFSSAKVAYLCVFDRQGWEPVAYTAVKNGRVANFKNVGKRIIFLPAVYQDDALVPAGGLFYIDDKNNIVAIRSNPAVRQRITVKRKYPLFAYAALHTQKLKGGKFQGSNSPDFSNPVLLGEIKHYPFYVNEININVANKFRYVRFVSPPGYMASLAELSFFGSSNDSIPLQGTIIGVKGLEGHELEKAFDSNLDSYYESNNYFSGWIGMDLGEHNEATFKKIRFCPRNDTNCILPGNEYELFYWNENWISLGRKTANNFDLDFEDVPADALYWLKCLSGGKEERIFTINKGMQVWW